MKKAYAEGIGSFIVVFAGSAAFVVGQKALGTAGVALAFGLAYAVAALALGPLSNALFNPALTLAFTLAGRLRARQALPILFAQLAGATVGTGLAIAIATARPGGNPLVYDTLAPGFGRHSPGFYGQNAALISEITLSAILALTLLSVQRIQAKRPAQSHLLAALAGGLALALVHVVGLPITGLPANPARALGLALLSPDMRPHELWVFVLAPFVGSALAALAHRTLEDKPASSPEPAADSP